MSSSSSSSSSYPSVQPQSQPQYIYVRVNRDQEFGFWEIDTFAKKAYFRENSHKRENNNQQQDNILDYTTVYNTVSSYLESSDFPETKKGTRRIYTKPIIKNRKTAYSDVPFCEWYKNMVDAHDPNTIKVCDKPALIIDDAENMLCGIHANEKFTVKFLPIE